MSLANMATINLTWTDLGSNPGFRGKRQATNRLNRDTANVLQFLPHREHSLSSTSQVMQSSPQPMANCCYQNKSYIRVHNSPTKHLKTDAYVHHTKIYFIPHGEHSPPKTKQSIKLV